MDELRSLLSTITDADAALSAFKNRSEFFRLNTLKINAKRFEETSSIQRTVSPYYQYAFRLDEPKNFEIGRTWEYFLGYIHPQSLSSIVTSLALDPKAGEAVLDAAASPGSKFSHMAMLMENKGVLVGNDLKKEKLSALYSNINRLNVLNCIVTMRDGAKLDWKARFDRVLLDAPCTALGSGEGAGQRWTPDHSRKISQIQQKMLFSAYDALKPGGSLVYSTCTYAKEENEEVVLKLLENVPSSSLEEIPLDIPCERGLSEYGDEFRKCMRIYPQHLNSEGFFIARIKKAG